MANTVGAHPTSQGTLPSAPAPIPVLERQVTTQAETSVPDFTQEFSRRALQPTAIGEAASRVSTSAGMALAEEQGYALAERDPNKRLLPSFTESDQAFANAYKAQSSAILGNQAQQLINQNLEELRQANQLTPELVNSFMATSSEGIQSILDNAPTEVRAQLSTQYASKLQESAHQLNSKMIDNYKEKSEQNQQLYRIHQAQNMQESIRSNTPQSLANAKSIFENLNKNIDESEASGLLTPMQAEVARTSNKLDYESGLQINNMLTARQNGTLEKYIATMAEQRLPGLTWAETEAVQSNVIKALTQVENAQRRDHSLTMAKGANLIQTGQMTPARLASFEPDLTPEEFTRLSTAYASASHEASQKNQAINRIISNPESAASYNGQTKDVINASFDRLTKATFDDAAASGSPISPQEAEFRTAATMNHPIPKYVDGINNALMGGTLDEAKSAMEQLDRLHAMAGFKTVGITDRAKATAEMFNAIKGQYPGNEEEALNKARENISNKTDEVIRLNNVAIDTELGKHKGAQKLNSWAIKVAGFGSANYDNLQAFTANAVSQFSSYMQLTNGNVDVSTKMTQDMMSKLYAPTHVNGERQISYLPLETMMQLPAGATPLIQSDIIRGLEPQFAQSKASFDQGNSQSYWRVKEGRVSYEEYAKAKEFINQEMSFKGIKTAFKEGLGTKLSPSQILINKLQPSRDIVEKYEAASPIEVEQVTKSGVKTYTLNVTSSPYTQVSGETGQVIGSYDVGIKDPVTGAVSAMHGYFGGVNSLPEVRPSKQWVRERYLSVNGLAPTPSFEKNWDSYLKAQANPAPRMSGALGHYYG